jgi:hypothetical protein
MATDRRAMNRAFLRQHGSRWPLSNTWFRKWREGKVRPIQGNAPHGRILREPDFKPVLKRLRRSLTRRSGAMTATNTGAPSLRFLRHGGIYRSDAGVFLHPSLEWSRGLPPAAPHPSQRMCREEHTLLIVSMSSGRLFLDRVGRHQSPSPLRRHEQLTMHFRSAYLKPERSTLLKSGTFYFALTASGRRVGG